MNRSLVIGLLLTLLSVAAVFASLINPNNKKDDDFVVVREPTADEAKQYLVEANEALRVQKNKIGLASWEQSSNINDANDAAYIKASEEYDIFAKAQFDAVKNYFTIMPNLAPHERRQFEKMGVIGTSALNPSNSLTFSEASLKMKKIYSEATVTANGKSGQALEPELTNILATSTNETLLREVWMNWRDATGPLMRQDYATYYRLGNKAATLNSLPGQSFKTYDDLWMFEWETPDMKAQVDKMMEETLPLYRKIHAYVRHFLKQKYGESVMPKDGTIPAHLLGNMWAQQWGNLLSLITEMNPFPDVDPIDSKVNAKLENPEWTVKKMFELSETFFHNLGMDKMTQTFWDKSILEKPTDRNLTCHASAWDFYDSSNADFRIKQCTDKNINDLITVHHEMGHVQYYMNYVVQPVIYRRGANPGFHEAIGDLIALSVATPDHLIKVGLLDPETPDNLQKINLNYQLKMALDKIAFLPFAYVMDKWRWDVFGDPAIEVQLNKRWWELRLQYQGLSPPVTDRKRNENDFDPGAKYHIPAGVEYVRYFASHVLQFQFYEKMCSFVPGVTDLYKCDFDGNKEAGAALMAMLAKGSSDNWKNILRDFIGSETMSLSSLNKYFKPLEDFLDDYIAKNSIEVGWTANVNDYYDAITPEQYLSTANDQYREAVNTMTVADWAMGSNISAENEAALVDATEDFNIFRQKQFAETKQFDYSGLEPVKKRQFEKFAVIGTSALDEEDTKTFQTARLGMEATYSTAKITANGQSGLELEPDLTTILATSTNETLLREVWVNFRDATGPKMRQQYITYYKLGNKAATLNKLPDKDFDTFDDLWMFSWEADDLKDQIGKLMDEAMPLYQKVHAYVRYFLRRKYGDGVMPADGTIPAHLLGNMWAQQWGNILNTISEMNPNPDVNPIDATVNEKLQPWSIKQMYEVSETFFADLGMDKMTDEFWEKSIIEKPSDRDMTCHASAWDFFDVSEKDFRIKQCTERTINQLTTVHHEMGHIQYYMNYVVQQPVYREGANPGFHEAIGDLIALAVATPDHLVKIGLLDPITDDTVAAKINLNYQLKMALQKIVFLPFSYVMDKWRWDVFGDASLESKLNEHWWELRLKYQGLSPPVTDRKRNENDFDPGAKYHIPAGVEYVRYFVSHVLQFQFYEKLCSYVQNVPDLYKCDFNGNKDAGAALITMLKKGSSDRWQNILRDFIGSETMSLSALNRYFQPLEVYLDAFLSAHNITVGWNPSIADYVELTPDEYITTANEEYRVQTNLQVEAEWAQGSNITEENEANLVAQIERYNIFRQAQFRQTKEYDYGGLEPVKKRQFEKFAVIGTSALDEEDTKTFNNARLRMEGVYSTATITVGNQSDLALEPDLTEILATSTDEPTLREVWLKFRDATGAKMRDDYITYYTLGNKAAQLNKLPDKEFKTFDDLWMFSWEADDLKDQVAKLMDEAMPLYQKVHAYVRYFLKEQYGSVMPADGTIPAHLLGNMWAQSWSDILNTITKLNPNPDVDPIDNKVNAKLATWEIERMYRLSETFFAELGMDNMTQTFWDKSILVKPSDRNLTCHASAWDFYNGEDFRIKQCTERTISQLITVHHEMGHIQYFMNYAKQPAIYREGANPGFHEAIGDLIALSVATPEHLTKVGLLDPITDSDELAKINLNYQLKMALEKVVFLPFSYVMDKWRWDVFGDESMKSRLNKRWWELRLQYQGISPPVQDRKRNEKDFDPGAKYHIPAGVEYVRYFVSHVLQFQFFEKMCENVQSAELYQCDFNGNKDAGGQLRAMLEKGSSDKWQNILKAFIGNETMSLGAMNKYFKPLNEYLDKFIADNKIEVGWKANVDDYVESSGLRVPVNLCLVTLCLGLFTLAWTRMFQI